MYENFYHLTTKPFQMVPNPAFLYLSDLHRNALTYLEYGVMERVGFILLTGEVGTGKTTLIRYLLDKLPANTVPALLFNTNVNGEQLIRLILHEFEVEPVESKAGNIDLLQQYLIERYAAGKNPLLIIDEAQNLSDEALEEVRMLSNLQTDDEMLLQVIIAGQPELKKRLLSPHLAQLRQRVAASYHLTALSEQDTAAYIAARLVKAGGDASLFREEAVAAVFRASDGIPRTINLLCDAALVYGFADEVARIDPAIIEQVVAHNQWGSRPETETEAVSRPPLPEGRADENSALAATVGELEARVREMHLRLDLLQTERENRGREPEEKLLNGLGLLLQREREKSDRLLEDTVLLRTQIQALTEKISHPGNTPVAAQGHDAVATPEEKGLVARVRQLFFAKAQAIDATGQEREK
ncbi:MAG: AAA family ATPase [Proteobacteria bacterium]|nr:AAA family ATPase [Pseudomonadota bacterium]MBU1547879.1 AAA family ATPase [Pseudomonadota bacterium]